MQYRTFGKTGFEPSALGFGCMRLPRRDGVWDEDESIRMIRHAIDAGVNYVDTAYGYCDGQSESIVGRALLDGYRDRVHLATKLPPWDLDSAADMDRVFDEQRERLQSERIDCYMLHAMNQKSWDKLLGFGVLEWAEQRRSAGQIGRFGFSFHDSFEVFMTIVDAYPLWDFCQVQYNYMDVENQAGTAGVKYASDRGLGVIVMEPLLGGRLAAEPPPAVAAVWAEAAEKRTPADWALQWVWSQPETSLLLSGMSTMEQVEQNVASAERSGVGVLSLDDMKLAGRARSAYEGVQRVPCTECGYCQPCEQDVNIPRIFSLANNAARWGEASGSKRAYAKLREEHGAQRCVHCGECEAKCPQRIDIMSQLEAIDRELMA